MGLTLLWPFWLWELSHSGLCCTKSMERTRNQSWQTYHLYRDQERLTRSYFSVLFCSALDGAFRDYAVGLYCVLSCSAELMSFSSCTGSYQLGQFAHFSQRVSLKCRVVAWIYCWWIGSAAVK